MTTLRRLPPRLLSIVFLWAAVFLLFLLGDWLHNGFFSTSHAGAIFRTASFIGLTAIGQTLVVLTGGIDLSVGPLISLGNVFACLMMKGMDENNLFAISIILLIGAGIGILNGLGVSVLGISPMVMTLATGVITTGITLIYSQGAPTGHASPALRTIGVGFTLGVPNSVWIWVIFSALVILICKFTTFGRGLYYIGANSTAATFSGLRTHVIKSSAYAISGIMAALTGVIIAGYTSVALINIGKDYTMSSITAVVIGGTAMTGGKGSYGGTIAGAVLICLIESILTNLNMQEAGKKIMNGIIILVLITLYYRKGQGAKA